MDTFDLHALVSTFFILQKLHISVSNTQATDIIFKKKKKNHALRNQTDSKTGHSFTKEVEGYFSTWK